MRIVKASGWRWWSKKRAIFISFGTDMYWFHLEVGPVSIAVERDHPHWRSPGKENKSG
jgi:hypothetical protein